MASLPEIYRQLINEFTTEWSGGDPPCLDDYLRRAREQLINDDLSPDFVLTLIEVDLINRIFRRSQDSAVVTAIPRVEDYRAHLQQHCQQSAIPNGLIAEEYRARVDAGEQPTIDEYMRRFERGESLENLLKSVRQTEQDPNATQFGAWSPVAPKILGRYRIEKELGRGGMGVVYEATAMDGGPPVALKTLQNRDAGSLTRFKNEFRVLADLTHPNLVRLGELVTTSIEPFFTMEIIDGVRFDEYVRSGLDTAAANPNLPFTEHRLRDCLKQLADGLYALHEVGCIHRDIKPSNVLVTTKGRVVLLDFGLAVEATQRRKEFAGTPFYMAPEQAQGKEVTAAVDSYAVGVMLFETLTGERPFSGRGMRELLAQKLSPDRPEPQDLITSIPEDLNRLCNQLLQVDPRQRPDAGAIRQLLTGGLAAPDSADVWIGRDSQLTTLDRAWADVVGGQTRVVLVSGSSGVGKTAVVDRFLKDLHGRSRVVILRGRCYENESVPYQGFDSVMDALVQHLKRMTESQVERVLPLEIEPLCQIFPALLDVPAIRNNQTARRAYGDPRERRQQGLSAVREMLSRLARWESLVIFVDDLQWGDADTAVLFRELLRNDQAPQMLFIGTYRSEEASSECLQQIRRSQQKPSEQSQLAEQVELSVDRLEPAEARRLADDLLQQAGMNDDGLARQVAKEADGDPLFIRVFVRQLIDAKLAGESMSDAAGEWTLHDVLWKQVCSLDPIARNAIELLSVAGRPLRVADLEAIACRGQDQVGLTRSLRVKRMIRRLSDHRTIETYHDKIRETIIAQLSDERLQSHCLALAERLETKTQDLDVEFLADLFRRAGKLSHSGEYYVQAAESATEQLAFTSAVQYYRRAIEQIVPTGHREQELRTRLGDALANVSRAAEAADEYLRAAAIADVDDRPPLYQNASLRLLTSGHVDEGLDALKYALRSFRLPWPRTMAHAVAGFLYRVGLLRLRRFRLAKRDTPVTDREQKCLDVCWSAAAGLSVVDPVRAAFYVAENLLRALRCGNSRSLSRDLAAYMGHAAIGGTRSRREVKRLLLVSRDVSRMDPHPYSRAMLLTARGSAALLRGDWPKTQRACDRAIEYLSDDRCQDITWELNTARTFALWALQYQGDLVELSRRQPTLLRTAKETNDHFAMLNFSTQVMTHLLTAADRPDEAVQRLAQDRQLLSDRGFFVQHHNQVLASTYLQIYMNDAAAAFAQIDGVWKRYRSGLLSQVQQVRIDHFQVLTRAALAAAAADSKARPQMLKIAINGIRRLRKERAPWASALALAFEASSLHQSGDTAGAIRTLENAERALEKVHMKLFANAARHHHARLSEFDDDVRLGMIAAQWQGMGVVVPARMANMLIPGFSP